MSTQQTSARTGKKGQLLTTDLMLSVGVFLSAFMIMYYLWEATQAQLFINTNDLEMSKVALSAADSLAVTAGQDSHWQATSLGNSSAFGASWRRNELVSGKLAALSNLTGYNNTTTANYYPTKEKLGSGRYELYVEVLPMSNLFSTPYYKFGKPSPPIPTTSRSGTIPRHSSQTVQRLATLNGSEVVLRVQVWGNITSG